MPTSGLLSGEEILASQMIANGAAGSYRASTYDLRIGTIVPAGSRATNPPNATSYVLPPGGTVRVICREILTLPDTITGHVLLKNELCRKGILAINIGVVDPGFSGPISSTLINFGRGDYVVSDGTPFLRVSFHRCPQSPKATNSKIWDPADYLNAVREEVLAYSAPTFLNVEHTASQAAEKAFGAFKRALIIWATVLALLVAMLAIFAPLGASIVDKYLTNREKVDTALLELKLDAKYASQLKELSDEVEKLKKPAPPANSGDPKPRSKQGAGTQ